MTSAPANPPRIELHVHLEGSIRPATLLDIAQRNDMALPADSVAGLTELYAFTDFRHFIDVWVMTTNCLRTATDFAEVVENYAAEAAGFGAVYIEGIFSPCERVQRGVTWDELFTGYVEGAVAAQEKYGVTVRFTPDLYRGVEPEIAEECARTAVRYRDRGVLGLGLGGLETGRAAAPYATAFKIARDGGLAIVPHAGEVPAAGDGTGGVDSIREVLAFNPERIRHGIRAVDDPGILAELAARGTVLDVCPTSNLRTRVVADLAEHPLPQLKAAGVHCTINTDDPAMFNTDLGTEYAVAAGLGITDADAYAAGLVGAVCDKQTRDRLAALA
jgi:aminodeoxyfutalosine deaminase